MIDLRSAPKDCECSDNVHIGPHWLHEDRLTFERNLKLIQPPRGQLAGLAFAQSEAVRLQNKRFAMCRYTRDEEEVFIFPEGYREKDYQARVKEALADIIEDTQR